MQPWLCFSSDAYPRFSNYGFEAQKTKRDAGKYTDNSITLIEILKKIVKFSLLDKNRLSGFVYLRGKGLSTAQTHILALK